ncbi:MAG: hypothetical protein K0S70_216 [Microbacterium sp.]|nr:hypothetical protein [Microbacterium sp.]
MQRNPLLGEPREEGRTQARIGQVVSVDGALQVAVGGVVQEVTWADPLIVQDGDAALLVYAGGSTGQAQAVVLATPTDRPRPARGTVLVVPPGSDTITVTTSEGQFVADFLASYTPGLGDYVRLLWSGTGVPTVLGAVGVTSAPAPPPPPPPPPGPSGSGVNSFSAIDSGTFQVGSGWNDAYGFGQELTQGAWGSRSYTGSWFYGSGPNALLVGRTVTRVRFYVGARRRIGSYNADLSLHLYLHGSPTRPGGDVARIAGPSDVVLPPNSGPVWVDLPPLWGQHIVNFGGGIGIAGNPYGGVTGRGTDPMSGLIEIAWQS